MDEQRERVIIARLKAGDIRALTPLVKEHQQRALRTAYLITQDQALAEDVVQSAFVRACEAMHQFDASRRFLPWFMRIVANLSVQTAQKQSAGVSLDYAPPGSDSLTIEELLSDDTPSPESEIERQELADSIQQMLQRLSPDQRAVIVLRYYADLSEDSMAALLAVPPGTIKSRLYAARRQLRGWLRLYST